MASEASVHHPIFARLFAWAASKATPEQIEHRRRLLEGLTGRVIEVGAGNGLNFRHYPQEVTEVLAVEPEPYLRGKAEEAAAAAPVPVRVVDGLADSLPAADAEFDAGVASLVLCSVARPPAALAELQRVLRPGGELRFYEHVRAKDPRHARKQDRINRVWPHLAGGCHPNRDTPASIEAAGFEIERCDRFAFRPAPGMKVIEPHVIGVARRP
jgi:ubiquinone/menaquinone biosynthesis C-methylase UbiE